jgi:hypothetical protein
MMNQAAHGRDEGLLPARSGGQLDDGARGAEWMATTYRDYIWAYGRSLTFPPEPVGTLSERGQQLQDALSESATQMIRSRIDRAELTPDCDTLESRRYGHLTQIIAFSETPTGKHKGPVSQRRGRHCRCCGDTM